MSKIPAVSVGCGVEHTDSDNHKADEIVKVRSQFLCLRRVLGAGGIKESGYLHASVCLFLCESV